MRAATAADLPRVAQLHHDRIDQGFLSSLGIPFLLRLYRRVLRSSAGFVLVEESNDLVVGFVAGVENLGALYRSFVIHDGVAAGIRAAPRLVRALPRVIETLRYPTTAVDLPSAEILAVSVADDHGGRGIGRRLVLGATAEFTLRRVGNVKVVTTADNAAALAMYRAAGFVSSAQVTVHTGRDSEVLVWTAS